MQKMKRKNDVSRVSIQKRWLMIYLYRKRESERVGDTFFTCHHQQTHCLTSVHMTDQLASECLP